MQLIRDVSVRTYTETRGKTVWGVGAFGQAHKPLVVVQSGEAVVSIGRTLLVVGGAGRDYGQYSLGGW